jgi:hypothetical protein
VRKYAIKAKRPRSPAELRDDLNTRKRGERLPERRAALKKTRIAMIKRSRTFMGDLRFAAMRPLIVTGSRYPRIKRLRNEEAGERPLVVSWTIGTRPDANLVNTMLDAAIETVGNSTNRPVVYSDRGAHYRWLGWLTRMRDARLVRSDVTQRMLAR